jgi:hypothetical protein
MGSSRLLSFAKFAILAGLCGVAGCASDPGFEAGKVPNLIPPTAVRVAEGTAPLSYVPYGPATVYILDDATGSLMNTSYVPSNASDMFFVIDPMEKAVLVKDATKPSQRIVLAAPIDTSHRFSIWVVRETPTTRP